MIMCHFDLPILKKKKRKKLIYKKYIDRYVTIRYLNPSDREVCMTPAQRTAYPHTCLIKI